MNRTIALVSVSAVLLIAGGASIADDGIGEERLSIKAQELSSALRQFSEQTGLQVGYAAELAEGKETQGIEGIDDPERALDALLVSTGLEHYFVNDSTVIIRETMEGDDEGGDSHSKNLTTAPTTRVPIASTARNESDTAGPVSGTVTEASTGAVLRGALITVAETGQTAVTDDLGQYRFPAMSAGRHTLSVSFLGYAEQSSGVFVQRGAPATLDFALVGGVEFEEIVVYGTRSARAAALSQERAAENTSSVVSADMLGDFSGTTISEALRRVAGISFQRDLQTGDGFNVIVRGLEPDMNAVKLNGLHLPVGNGTDRSADLANILADSVATIVVNKSLLPSHDSAGTGGLIEIETISPLGRPRRYMNFAVEGGRKDADFGDDLLLSGTVSGIFGSREELGISASVQYRERDLTSIEYGISGRVTGQYLPLEQDGSLSISSVSHIDPRTPFPFEPGAGGVYPSSVGTSHDETETVNTALTVSGEWSVNDLTNLRFDVQRSVVETDVFSGGVSVNSSTLYLPGPVASLGGEVRQVAQWSGMAPITQNYVKFNDSRNETTTYSLKGATKAGQWEFDYTLGYARGTSSRPDTTAVELALNGGTIPNDPAFFLPGVTDPIEGRTVSLYGARVDRSVPLPLLTDAGWNHVNDPANYGFTNALVFNTQGENERKTLAFGAKRSFDRKHLNYVEIGVDYESAVFSDFTDTALYLGQPQFVTMPCCSLQYPGISSLGLAFEANSFAAIGVSGPGFDSVSRSALAAFSGNLGSLAEDASVPISRLPLSVNPQAQDVFTKEDNLAAYLQARLDFGKLEVIGGVRLSRVEVQAVNLTFPSLVDEFFQPDLVFAQEFTRLVDERATATDVLPRILFNYRQSDRLIYRGGYYLAVARPSVGQLSSDRVILLALPPFSGPDGNQPLLQIDEGNPDLEPSVTHNFSLGVELYDDDIGVIKLDAFFKKIDNLLQTNARVGFDSLDGVTLPDHPAFQNLPPNTFIIVSRPVNSAHSAELWGVELHAEHQFTSLPGFWNGFGVFANYTFTETSRHRNLLWAGSPVFDGSGNLTGRESVDVEISSVAFDQQPKHSGTVALTYNKHRVDATLAYSFQDRRLSFFDRHNLSVFEEATDSLDLRVEYRSRIGDRLYRVYVEGVDLLKGTSDPDLERSIGGVGSTPKYYIGANYLGGRAFRLGFAASF